MEPSRGIATSVCIVLASIGCGSKPHRGFGRVEDLQQRAEALGCHLKKYNVVDERCEVLVGPCSCRLELSFGERLNAAGDRGTGEILTFGVGLEDCSASQSLESLWRILDPMFDNDRDRQRLHAAVANRPQVKGAASGAMTELDTDVGQFRAEIRWDPAVWDAVKLPDPGLAEWSTRISLFTPASGHPDAVSTGPGLGHADYPMLCRDGTRRPWAERPIHPSPEPATAPQ